MYDRGKSIRISVTFQDRDNVYIDPTTPLIKIVKTGGAEVVGDTALIKETTGNYYYIWDTSETDETTDYYARAKGTYSGHTLLTRVKITLYDLSE